MAAGNRDYRPAGDAPFPPQPNASRISGLPVAQSKLHHGPKEKKLFTTENQKHEIKIHTLPKTKDSPPAS
jgi:hypothetical protein